MFGGDDSMLTVISEGFIHGWLVCFCEALMGVFC